MTTPALPPGFELEPTQANSAPALPPGFEIITEDDSSYGAGAPLEIDIVGGTPDSQYRDEFIARATDNMSGLDQFRAGIGKSLVDTAYGVGQLAVDQLSRPANIAEGLVGGLSPDNPIAQGVKRTNEFWLQPQKYMENQAAERRAIDADLMSTGAGLGGNVVGTAAQMIGPGAVLRGTTAARAFLPSTIGGNIAQGAVLGAAQPHTDSGDQAINTGLGGLFGGIGAGLVKAAGGTINGLRNLLSRSGLTNAERRAGEIILRESTNPSGLTFEESAVPGVQRTLGESTQDPGLMALENTMRARNRGAFDPIDQSNNAARVQQLQQIAGTDADMAAAIEAREAASSGLRDTAFKEGEAAAEQARQQASLMLGQDSGIKSLREQVSSMASSASGRPSVQSAVKDVDRALKNAGDSVGGLYQVRQYIGDLMEGKAGNDKSYAKAATRELMQIRDALDEQLASRAPSFPEYLQAYRGASKPINRMEVGREVIGKASGSIPDQLGNPVLTPAGMMRATSDLDAISAKATGFKKAKAADILTPADVSAIKAIQDDMVRQAARQRSATVGSQTAERVAIGERLAQQSILGKVPVVGQIFEHFEKVADDALQERLAFLIANPKHARRVIDALPKNDQKPVRQMLANLAMATSKSAGTKKEAVE